MQKNVTGQKWYVFAFDSTTNVPLTGDAANITGNLRIDGGAANPIDDTNPTELEDGYYVFDITQTESNGDYILITPASSTANIIVIGCPAALYTEAPNSNLLGIESDGDLTKVNTLDGHTPQTANNNVILAHADYGNAQLVRSTTPANTLDVSATGNASSDVNLYNGSVLTDPNSPSTIDQVSKIGQVGGGGGNQVAASFTLTTGSVVSGTYTDTFSKNGVEHQIADTAGTLDCYYEMNIGANGSPSSIFMFGRINGGNDDINIYAWNWITSGWDVVIPLDGKVQSSNDPVGDILLSAHVGTGTDSGKVRIRYYGTGLSSADLYIEQLYVSYSIAQSPVGYANASVYIDTINGTAGQVVDVNGVGDFKSDNWTDALAIAIAKNLNRFVISNGSTILLNSNTDGYTLTGDRWILQLGGQSIEGSHFYGCSVTGTGTATVLLPEFNRCDMGAVTIPPAHLHECGIGKDSGTFTAGSAGEYIFMRCLSLVPGSGTPSLVFSGLGSTTGINNRGWLGGSNYTLDSDCTISHEVLAGGGQTFTTGGGNVELRGIFRESTFVLSGAGTVQQVGVCGDITISGTATTTVNLHGVSNSLIDTSVNTTVTDDTVSTEAIADIPTVTEFNARSLPSADYVVVSDTIAGVTLATTTTDVTNAVVTDAASRTASKADVSSLALEASITQLKGATFSEATDSNEAIRNRGDVAWITGAGGDATEAKQDTIIANLGTVDTNVDSILMDTGTTLPAAIAAVANDVITTTLADIANTASITAGATITVGKALRAAFNRFYRDVTQTATLQTVKNDGGTTIASMTTSDDGTTQTKGAS